MQGLYIYIYLQYLHPAETIIFHYAGPPRCKAGTDPGSATRCFWMSCGNVVQMARAEVKSSSFDGEWEDDDGTVAAATISERLDSTIPTRRLYVCSSGHHPEWRNARCRWHSDRGGWNGNNSGDSRTFCKHIAWGGTCLAKPFIACSVCCWFWCSKCNHVRRIFMWTVAVFWCILTIFFLSWKCWVPPKTDMFKFDCQVSFPAADSIAFCPGGGQTQPLLIIHWKYLSWTDPVFLPVLDLSRPLKHGTHVTVDCLSRSSLQRQTGWWQEGSTANQQKEIWKLSAECQNVTRFEKNRIAGVMVAPGSESKKSIPSLTAL